jgi:hypothetical protein
MNLRVAIALIALASPAVAQHGGGHAGSSGSRGFAGHAGFSGSVGVARSGSFARSAQPTRYGAPGSVGFRAIGPPNYASRGIPAYGNRFAAVRPIYRSYQPSGSAASRDRDRGGDGDRNRFDARRRSFNNWYNSYYPIWPGYGYPYLIDPGFYDWSEPDDSGNNENAAAAENEAPSPDYGYGAPDEGPEQGYAREMPPWVPPSEQSGPTGTAFESAPAPEEPLTVIFKGDRAPVKMQNYMMTARVLTDLDSRHYEQIPFDEIDVGATQRANSAAGIEFQIPNASRD